MGSNEVTVVFRMQYKTFHGQMLYVIGNHPALGGWERAKALEMIHGDPNDYYNWSVHQTFTLDSPGIIHLEYKYIVLTSSYHPDDPRKQNDLRAEENAEIRWDAGPNRFMTIRLEGPPFTIVTSDLFQPTLTIDNHILFKKPFLNVIYRHPIVKERNIIRLDHTTSVRLRVIALQVPPDWEVHVTGNLPIFNNWSTTLPLTKINNLYWEFALDLGTSRDFDYKYLIRKGDEVIWESRTDRHFFCPEPDQNTIHICHDWLFQQKVTEFKGSGVTLRLSSCWSRDSLYGIGEFMDLKKIVDWAVKANFLMVQLLPIQDINCTFNQDERNPSALVSAFAFNYLYLTLSKVPHYDKSLLYKGSKSVAFIKLKTLERIFNERLDRVDLLSEPDYQLFVKQNEYWLRSYAIWCSLRDEHLNDEIPPYTGNEEFTDRCLFYTWVQYLCHQQLTEVCTYATKHRVALFSTMTIGLNYKGSDVWRYPEMFDLSFSLGAPPDVFSFHGQNWHYPVWNWQEMAKNDYSWLKHQISHHELYFQGCQFDHPLGFFRSWEIPTNSDNPLLGYFVPSKPIELSALQELQIRDVGNLCRPLFPIQDILSLALSESTKRKIIQKLAVCDGCVWRFRSLYEGDKMLLAALKEIKAEPKESLQMSIAERILLSHFESVCLIPDQRKPHRWFYPRFSMTDSNAFNALGDREAQIMYKLFVDFYFRDNYDLWIEGGTQKLSLLSASPMMFIGYNLGASLKDAEAILQRFGILTINVPRFAKDTDCYLSICSPTTHDLPNLRVWWKQSKPDVQHFYHQVLGRTDDAPDDLTPEIAEGIMRHALSCRSLWTSFRFEDLFALSPSFDECAVNSYNSVEESWDYQMGVSIDDLLENHSEWTSRIAQINEECFRSRNAEIPFPEP